ncbi:hypothetical protein [Arthrobacter sp. ZGTC412]|jgi:uncharacterized low-complexity protein|uniref:hypothetical protein n=1 Tax=Arthrobacter sp. ZGTC412 TaxID=2058900 RepID=UPI000CE528C2|nr:hypothetical protein [Arthrobacter sp. ZGTC412]
MLKKIAAAAVLAGALAFSAAAPAVLAAGSPADNAGISAGSGNWPNPMTEKGKKAKGTETPYTPYSGNWPNPM